MHWTSSPAAPGDERTLRGQRGRLRPAAGSCPGCCAAPASGTCGPRCSARRWPLPVLVAPTAFHRLAHPDGELATARAAAAAGTVMVVSMAATQPVEDIAAAPAADAVVPALPAAGPGVHRGAGPAGRGGRLPGAGGHRRLAGVRPARARPAQRLPRPAGRPGLREHARRDRPGAGRSRWTPTLGWDRIDWLRGVTGLPILLKGVLHPGGRPARRRARRGRRADRVQPRRPPARRRDPPPLDALPAVVEAVGGRIPVLLDGGVRRGTDVLIALALGASAVRSAGRCCGALAGGRRGGRPAKLLELLRAELDQRPAPWPAPRRPAGRSLTRSSLGGA